jgi:hypothetical protein
VPRPRHPLLRPGESLEVVIAAHGPRSELGAHRRWFRRSGEEYLPAVEFLARGRLGLNRRSAQPTGLTPRAQKSASGVRLRQIWKGLTPIPNQQVAGSIPKGDANALMV